MKKEYFVLERNVLILIAIPLPAFSFVYLYTSSGNLDLDIPTLPSAWWPFILIAICALLLYSLLTFNKAMMGLREANVTLEDKWRQYARLTIRRFYLLFMAGILCAIGLLFYENPGFTVAYAITLGLVSLGKPTPDRIIRLLRLKGEDREIIEDFKRRD
ncbi:hypothetical protein [Echinicola pacifica]|nr:hypothetical protein [Echinicola pacifica]